MAIKFSSGSRVVERRRQWLLLALATVLGACVPWVSWWSDFEGVVADPLFAGRMKRPKRPAARIVIVQVGPATYKEWSSEPQTFWPLHLGPLIANLRSPSVYSARLVGLDYVLRSVAGPTLERRYRQPNDRWPETRLIQALQSYGGVILGMTDQEQPDLAYVKLGSQDTDTALLTVRADFDRLTRKVITYRRGVSDTGGEAIQPGIAAAMALRASGQDPLNEAALHGLTDVESTEMTDGLSYTVGEARINFYGPNGSTIPRLEALDVERGKLAPEDAARLKDALVLIGTAAPEDQDTRSGPGRVPFDGVEFHAQALATFLDRRPLKMLPKQVQSMLGGLAALLAGVATLFGALPFRKRPLVYFAVPGILVCAALYGMEQAVAVRLFGANTLIPTAAWTTGLLLGCGGQVGLLAVIQSVQKRELEGHFSQHVGDAVLKRIIQEGVMPPLKREQVTVMFIDLRGFTRTAGSMEPEIVAAFLNRYFEEIVACVYEHGGFVDKFIGDGVMAFWNAPERQPDHADRALKAAVAMVEAIADLDRERVSWGIEDPLRVGIGINTGEAVVGNLGSKDRNNFTVIGNSVNLAARIESLTKELMATILLGQRTFEQVTKNIDCDSHMIQIRGVREVQTVYQLRRYEDVFIDEPRSQDNSKTTFLTRAAKRAGPPGASD